MLVCSGFGSRRRHRWYRGENPALAPSNDDRVLPGWRELLLTTSVVSTDNFVVARAVLEIDVQLKVFQSELSPMLDSNRSLPPRFNGRCGSWVRIVIVIVIAICVAVFVASSRPAAPCGRRSG